MNRFKPDSAYRPDGTDYRVSKDGDIRPYGILIKEIGRKN